MLKEPLRMSASTRPRSLQPRILASLATVGLIGTILVGIALYHVSLSPAGDAFALRTLALEVVGINVLVLLITLLVAVVLVRGLVLRPLQAIGEALERRVDGKDDEPVPEDGPGEIGRMACRMNAVLRAQAESAAQIRAIVECAGEGIFTMDDRGKIASFNQAATAVFGYTADEVIGHDVGLLIPSSTDSVVNAALRNGNKNGRREVDGRRKDGTLFPLSANVTAVRVGTTLSFTAIVRDLTERKQAEDALRRQALVFANITDGVILTDSHNHILDANPGAERMFGYNRDELVGKTTALLSANPIRGIETTTVVARVDADGRWVGERAFRRKDGSEGICDTVVVPLFDGDGKKRRATIAVHHDVTERVRVERQLRESEERYRLMAQHVTDIIARLTPFGVFIYVSPACQRLLGYEPEELIGRPEADFLHPDDQAEAALGWHSVAGPAETSTVSYRLRKHDGQYGWFETTRRAVRERESGGVESVLAVTRDITARKRAERQLATEHAAARVLAEADSVSKAVPEVMRAFGDHLGWCAGEFWQFDPEVGALRRECTWSLAEAPFAEFLRLRETAAFARGIGLPGLVWASGEPIWIADVRRDPRSVFRAEAAQAGLVGGLALPVRNNNELLGVLSFFMRDSQPPDEDLMRMARAIVSQLGQFLQHQRAKEALARQHQWLEVTLASIGDAVLTTDISGAVTYLNPVAERLTGWASVAARGLPCTDVLDIVDEPTGQPVPSPVAAVMRAGQTIELPRPRAAEHTRRSGRAGRWSRGSHPRLGAHAAGRRARPT